MCGSFPWDMCIIFTDEFHFSLLPTLCITCTRLQFNGDFHNFYPLLFEGTSIQVTKERLCGKEENFLKCFIFLHLRGIVNLRNGLSVAQLTQCNYETNWKLFPWWGCRVCGEGVSEREDMCLCQPFLLFLFFLSLFLSSSFLQSQGYILGWLCRNKITLHSLVVETKIHQLEDSIAHQ